MTTLKNTIQTVEKYLDAMPASFYRLAYIHDNKEVQRPINKPNISRDAVIKDIAFMRRLNAKGYNIYCRPVSNEFILVDDLSRISLEKFAALKPCVLMETSRGNYQGFIRLDKSHSNEITNQISKDIAIILDGDMNATQYNQVGRLPGFSNRKSKYKDLPLFFVRLHGSENRLTSYQPNTSPPGGAPALTSGNSSVSPGEGQRLRSKFDFASCCYGIRIGRTDAEIYSYLMQYSQKMQSLSQKERENYFRRTIDAAHRAEANKA